MKLIRCALAILLLAASGIASATLTYDYPNGVLFDSSTNLYWRSGPQNLGGWQVAAGSQVISLFAEVGSFPLSPFPSSPATFSNVIADLVLFFSTGAPSPHPFAGSLPLGDLGDQFGCFGSCVMLFYGVLQWSANTPDASFDAIGFGYSGSRDVTLNDWATQFIATIGQYGRPGGPPVPAGAVFYLVSSTNPVPEGRDIRNAFGRSWPAGFGGASQGN
jgi:hypothetical protein